MRTLIARFVRDDRGQDLIEYALIGSFVSLAAAAMASTLGTNLNDWYSAVADWVSDATDAVPDGAVAP